MLGCGEGEGRCREVLREVLESVLGCGGGKRRCGEGVGKCVGLWGRCGCG